MSGQISNKILQARKSLGYTQAQVARAIGVSRPSYIAIEVGTKDLTISQAKLLARYLNISLEELIGAPDGILTCSNNTSAIEKYKQMILNSIKYGADFDCRITKTKLAKLVYLADFIWYYQHAIPMSGMAYRKLPQGPVPDVYFRALDELEDEGIISRESRGKAYMFSLVDKSAPNNKLSTEEQALIEKIGTAWQGKSTAEIVEFTHKQLPWQICRDGEVIPYGLITQEEPERVYGAVKL